ncbi:MAG: glutamate racemase [Candidatus Woesearchaeota archaeon]
MGKMTNADPIGLFDSGIGGFSIMRALRKHLPQENMVFLSDNARHPYGSKSEMRLRSISLGNSRFLNRHGSKMIVVACNTASAVTKEYLSEKFDTGIVGVIDAGVRAAVKHTRNGKIGVIGTRQTIASGSHEKKILEIRSDAEVFSKSTPLFAPIVEEGYLENPSTDMLIREELRQFAEIDVDTLILGCTHYPFLADKISSLLGDHITLIDPAEETAREIRYMLELTGQLNRSDTRPWTYVYSSDPSGSVLLPSSFSVTEDMIFKAVDVEELEIGSDAPELITPKMEEELLSL